MMCLYRYRETKGCFPKRPFIEKDLLLCLRKKGMKEMKKKTIGQKIFSSKEMGIFIPWVLICIVTSIVNPAFISMNNIINLLRSISITLIGAIGVTFVLISGQLDLSVGSIMGLGSLMTGFFLDACQAPVWISILGGLAAAALVGFFNGLVITRFKIPALIVTLGTMYIGRGIINVISRGVPFGSFPESFKQLGQGSFLSIPYSVYIAFAMMLAAAVILKYTTFGRSVMAIGGNLETARLSGIHVSGIVIGTYLISAACAGVAGFLTASRLSSAQANAGTGWEMTIVSAVVIGGTSMYGGSGSILGTLIGVAIMETLTVSMTMLRVDAYWQKVVVGAIIIIAVGIDTYRRAKAASDKG